MENKTELKRCAKCGAKGIVVPEPLTIDRPAYWYDGCTNISCENFDLNVHFNSEQEAIDDWNNRQGQGEGQ
jgi:hypothetical protein